MQTLTAFRQRLLSGLKPDIKTTTDGGNTVRTIVFSDGFSIPGSQPLPILKAHAHFFKDRDNIPDYMSLYHVYDCVSLKMFKYVSVAKKERYFTYTSQQRELLGSYLTGTTDVVEFLGEDQIDETDDQDDVKHLTKRRRAAQMSVGDIISQECTLVPNNSSFVLHNASINHIPYLQIIHDQPKPDTRASQPSSSTSSSTSTSTTPSTSSSSSRRPDGKSSTPSSSSSSSSRSAKGSAASASSTGKGAVSSNSNATTGEATIPIIILPSLRTSPVNIRNALDVFANFSLVPKQDGVDQEKDKSGSHMIDDHTVKIIRPSILNPSKSATFILTDSVSTLTPEQWRRVVGVVVSGREWQFDNFPFKDESGQVSFPTLFNQIKGLFFYKEGESIPEAVSRWNVEMLPISQNKRHLDAVLVNRTWAVLANTLRAKSRQGDDLFY